MCDALRELFADELKEREKIGMEQGMEQGGMAKLIAQVKRKMEKGQTVDRIAEDLMEPVEAVEEIYSVIERYPDCDIKFLCSVIAREERGEIRCM